MTKTLDFHGARINYRTGQYVISLTWVRDGAYLIELRYSGPIGVGPEITRRSATDEATARTIARGMARICQNG